MLLELEAGTPVRCLRGVRAGSVGTVVRCTTHYAFVRFNDDDGSAGASSGDATSPQGGRRTRSGQRLPPPATATKKLKRMLEACKRMEAGGWWEPPRVDVKKAVGLEFVGAILKSLIGL